MLARPLPLVLSLVLLSAAVAGCIGGGEEEVKIPTPDVDPAVDGNNTTGLGEVGTPTWSVGQWWAHHTYFGPDDKTGNHFNVVVTEAGGSGYRVASQNGGHAMKEAEMDLFDLGAFGTDLSTTYQGQAWTWYEWPLVHNKTWSQSLMIGDASYDLTFRALEATDLTTAAGPKEGFRINGTLADGTLVMTYDYVLEAGWFSGLEIVDPVDGARTFKITNMGYGTGKTGDYFEVSLADVTNETYSADTGPATGSFTVPEGTSRLVGTVTAKVETGLGTLTLSDAAGNAHEFTVTPPGGEDGGAFELEDPAAGEWTVSFLAVGTGSEAVVALTAVVETKGTL